MKKNLYHLLLSPLFSINMKPSIQHNLKFPKVEWLHKVGYSFIRLISNEKLHIGVWNKIDIMKISLCMQIIISSFVWLYINQNNKLMDDLCVHIIAIPMHKFLQLRFTRIDKLNICYNFLLSYIFFYEVKMSLDMK